MNRAFLIAVLVASLPATAAQRDLDDWFDDELLPYLADQLTRHPRFKGETVMFVVLDDNAPAPVSNALVLSLRDRLLDAALRTPGISIGARQRPERATPDSRDVDCTRDDVHYQVGIDISTEIDGRHRVRVRALDLEDRDWVTGFGIDWRGRLTTVQRRALSESRVDDSFRGARAVPFGPDETDLLAARLARDLGCALLRSSAGSYFVSNTAAADDDGLGGLIDLIGRNLAQADVLELAADDEHVNASLSGQAHPVDGALYQYWVTLSPVAAEDGLTSIGASAYVLMPGRRLARTSPLDAVTSVPEYARPASIVAAGRNGLLGPLRVAEPSHASACGDRGRCTLLTVDAHGDAIVFFLEYQARHGLVRLGGADCRDRTAARVATAGSRTQFPIGRTGYGETRMRPVGEWLPEPEADTYYALAVTDARAARRIANHLDRLPLRCAGTMRPGLTNQALHHWLDEFATLAARHAGHVDWRAIEVSDVL